MIVGHRLTSDLQQEEVSIDHGVAEVTLDVGHGLTSDLQAVAHPHSAEDLMEHDLRQNNKTLSHTTNYKFKAASSNASAHREYS